MSVCLSVCIRHFLIQTSQKSLSWCSPFFGTTANTVRCVFTIFLTRLARSLCIGVHLFFWHISWHSETHIQVTQLCISWHRLNKRSTKVSNKISLRWADGPEHSLGWYSYFVKIIIRNKIEVPPDQRSKLHRTVAPSIFEFEPYSFNL